VVQQQRLSLTHVPHRRQHRVLTQTLECSNPLVAVYYQVPLRLPFAFDDNDRHLLALLGKGGQQALFPFGLAHSQHGVAQVKLVKLKLYQWHAPPARQLPD
jgi:hypothetical protein